MKRQINVKPILQKFHSICLKIDLMFFFHFFSKLFLFFQFFESKTDVQNAFSYTQDYEFLWYIIIFGFKLGTFSQNNFFKKKFFFIIFFSNYFFSILWFINWCPKYVFIYTRLWSFMIYHQFLIKARYFFTNQFFPKKNFSNFFPKKFFFENFQFAMEINHF